MMENNQPVDRYKNIKDCAKLVCCCIYMFTPLHLIVGLAELVYRAGVTCFKCTGEACNLISDCVHGHNDQEQIIEVAGNDLQLPIQEE